MKDCITMENKSETSRNTLLPNNGIGKSVIMDVGRRISTCGYCKSGFGTHITHGLWSQSLTVHDYQALLDRGWRRAGCYLYKPEMENTCCPSYTIRLKATEFIPSKEQARVSKRMQRFLDGSMNVKNPDEQNEGSKSSNDLNSLSDSDSTSTVQSGATVDHGLQMNNIDQVMDYLSEQIDSVLSVCTERGKFPMDIPLAKASVKSVSPAKSKLQAEGAQVLLYSSYISFQISDALKRSNKNVQLSKLTCNGTEKGDPCVEPTPKFIAEVLSSHLSNSASAIGLSIKACNGHINFYSADTQLQENVIVGSPADPKETATSSSSKKRSLINSGKFQSKGQTLEIRLKRSGFDPEEHELYKKYQIKVHNDTPGHVTESSYKRFLVDSPLIFVPSSGDSSIPPCGFGSFHQQYLINGKLVAVGVIDILPKCVSSKYLFWDPDFAFLSLGKYSALQEINWVRDIQSHCPSLQYYYLGYYIHSCNKMRYKAAYRPSELLCPLRYQWVPYDIANSLLDRKPYVVLSDFATSQNKGALPPNAIEDQRKQDESNDLTFNANEDMSALSLENSGDESGPATTSLTPAKDISNIVIALEGMHMKYKDTRQAFGPIERNNLETRLHNYVAAVGTNLSKSMIYSLS